MLKITGEKLVCLYYIDAYVCTFIVNCSLLARTIEYIGLACIHDKVNVYNI